MAASAGDAESWLRFALTPALGPAAQRKLLKAFGGPLEVHAGDARVEGRGAKRRGLLAYLRQALDWLREPGNHLLTLADAGWSARPAGNRRSTAAVVRQRTA
jgi:DNA processing protein